MGDIAIRVSGLGKQYQIGAAQKQYSTLRDALSGAATGLARSLRDQGGRAVRDTIWALKDVSFEVKRGEVLGIIGRNGAGKSTLLKILARITEPTCGEVDIYGRVGSLLEVGTGFHPELTGRENIYLNGAVLGMRRREIQSKFDAIVDFSGIEKFIDTPVKHYSSGMYMRLAFAVAAHLEPEILLVDEVLAVGDAEFQKKCLGKMGEVASEGRTVLFVSHNMDAVRRLCQGVVWFEGGLTRFRGPVLQTIGQYLLDRVSEGGKVEFVPPLALANGMPVCLRAVQILGSEGQPTAEFSASANIGVQIDWENSEPLYKPRIGFVLLTSDGQEVLTALDASAWEREWLPKGRWTSKCVLPGQLLNEGAYVLDIGADGNPGRPTVYGFMASRTGAMLRFEIHDDQTLPNKYYGQEGFRDGRWPGVLLLNLPWRLSAVGNSEALSEDEGAACAVGALLSNSGGEI